MADKGLGTWPPAFVPLHKTALPGLSAPPEGSSRHEHEAEQAWEDYDREREITNLTYGSTYSPSSKIKK